MRIAAPTKSSDAEYASHPRIRPVTIAVAPTTISEIRAIVIASGASRNPIRPHVIAPIHGRKTPNAIAITAGAAKYAELRIAAIRAMRPRAREITSLGLIATLNYGLSIIDDASERELVSSFRRRGRAKWFFAA